MNMKVHPWKKTIIALAAAASLALAIGAAPSQATTPAVAARRSRTSGSKKPQVRTVA
jgi:anti-sigma-K factor RskA